MKSFCLRCCGVLLLLGLLAPLSAQHISLTTHTNYIPRVADFSTTPDNQSLGLDLRIFSGGNWAFRLGTRMQGADVYDVFSGAYQIEHQGNDWDDDYDRDDDHDWGNWGDWDDCEEWGSYSSFDTERFDQNYALYAEVGLERHIFLFNEKLDIYPGVYLPIKINQGATLQQALQREELLANAGAILGGSVRLLRIFRVGVELNAGMLETGNAISQGFKEASFAPIKAIPYQTSLTFALAF